MDVELITLRLRLRPRRRTDAPAFIAGLNDWEVVRWLTVVPYPYTVADLDDWMARQQPPVPGNGHFSIDLPGAGMIGVVSLDEHLGYWLSRAHHGKGYMTEACIGLLEWHFSARPDDLVLSSYHVGNDASAAVQRKLGFVVTGERRMLFVRSQQHEVEHIGTSLARGQFAAATRQRGAA